MTRPSLTYASGVILDAISQGVRHGFSLMDETGLPDGTVYPALRRMERNGWLSSRWEDEEQAHSAGRPARKYYALTDDGREVLADARVRFPGLASIPRSTVSGEEGLAS